MSTESILAKLQALSPGGVLTLPANAFGAGALDEVIAEYCEAQALRATGVALRQDGASVHLTGVGANAPFAGMALDASFVADPSSSTGALVTLVANPPPKWTFAASWGLLANSFLQRLAFSPVSLTLGTGVQGEAPKGLSFDGTLHLAGESHWTTLQWLVAQLATIELSGAIAMTGEVPVFTLSAPIKPSVPVPGLGQLQPTFQLSCEAQAAASVLPASSGAVSGPIFPAYAPVLDMSLTAQIQLGPDGVPVVVDLSSSTGLVSVDANVTHLTQDVLETVGQFLKVELDGFIPKTSSFDPLSHISLVDLGFAINPLNKTLTSTRIELATTVDWPLAKGIEITEIGFELIVPFKAPQGTPSVFATVFGSISLPNGGLDISGSYGNDFQLAAGLSEGSHVKLTDLLDRVLSTQLDAELYLDELEMLASTSGTWSLTAGLKGDWSFSVGIVEVALLEAWIQLGEEGSEVTGAISARARLGSGADALLFSGAWALPSTFLLSGSFPNIELSELATKLTGTSPPVQLPAVSLTGASASLALQSGSGSNTYYDFSMAASATLAGHGELGRAGFDVRKEGSGFGFLIGFELPVRWSPGDIWQPLAVLFARLSFERSGLLISTLSSTAPALKNMSMPSLPVSVGRGVTFFTSLGLTGEGFTYLAELFSAETKLDLLAVIDMHNQAESSIKASLRVPTGKKKAVEFTGLTLTLEPSATRFTLSACALFTLTQGTKEDQVTLTGAGVVQVEPSNFELQVTLKNWVEPFEIEQLTVDDFGLDLGVKNGVVEVGALGVITINQGSDSFKIAIGAEFADFEVPDAIVFELESISGKTLMLSSVIDELSSFDVTKVPLLGGIGFADLKLWLIGNPEGWRIGGYKFPQGVAVHADLTLYSWELTLDVEVHAASGIKAKGAVNHAINLFDVLVISSSDGTSGPSAGIDTTTHTSAGDATGKPVGSLSLPLLPGTEPPPYLWLDGDIKFMQIENYKIHAEVRKTAFDFELEFDLLRAVVVTLECSLMDDQNFGACADLVINLDLMLGPYMWEGIELIPQAHIADTDGSVSIAIAVNKTVTFDLAFGLAFDWSTVHVNVSPHFTAVELKQDLTQLWPTAVAWMQSNLDVVFSELLDDAKRWVEAIQSGVFKSSLSAGQVAKVLHGYFDTPVAEAASYLDQLSDELAFAFKDMVKALVEWFDVSAAEAARLLGQVKESCAITSADKQLLPRPPVSRAAPDFPSRTLFELSGSPTGERMLLHYHAHRDELLALRERPDVALRLARIVGPEDPRADARAVVDVGVEVLNVLREYGSPSLRAAIDETLPQLERRTGMTHDEFLADLRR
jgi:hypothetical protein